MPKSKRDKKISLTKTDKKGLALKQKIVEDVRNCVEKYNSIYVFTFSNMRTDKMQEVRQEWKPSRFFIGKNKVIALGLGRSKEDEIQDDLHKLSLCLRGNCGLLFTDCTKKEVLEWFQDFSYEDYARSGFKVKETIILNEGPLKQFSHAIEPHLRQLGMPSKLDRGVITLTKNFEVCSKGKILTPEQAKILRLLKYRLSTFKFNLKACWIKGEGFEEFENNGDVGENNEEDDVMDTEVD